MVNVPSGIIDKVIYFLRRAKEKAQGSGKERKRRRAQGAGHRGRKENGAELRAQGTGKEGKRRKVQGRARGKRCKQIIIFAS
jgi:hypothetical protein